MPQNQALKQAINGTEKYKEGDNMANISQNVNIEMLEKLPDGTYKRKYPKTRSDTGVTFDEHLAEKVHQGEVHGMRVNDGDFEYFDGAEWNKITGNAEISSWNVVQQIVRLGKASEVFEIGDELISLYEGSPIIWQVIGLDVDTPTNPNLTHSMTIQTKDCLHNIQFDAPEPSNPNSDRKSYGNNRYVHSAVKQWLNSDDAIFNWQSQHQYDATPTDSLDLYNGAGFLYRLDPELVAVLGGVKKKVAKNTATDGGGQEEFTDKIFLLSQKEVDLGDEGVNTGEFVYPFYQGKGNANRIKCLSGSTRSWWLRSPFVSSSRNVRNVYADGSLSDYRARSTSGVSPACVII